MSARFKVGPEGLSSTYQRSFIGRYHPAGTAQLEEGVIESYEEGDLRKDINIAPNFISIDGGSYDFPINIKFDLPNFQYPQSGFDFPVLRYTDVYLLYAETLAEISGNVPSESLDILNEVRNRAGLFSLTTSDVSDIASFRIAMEKERRSELMFECVRWFDLVRAGRSPNVWPRLYF